jgi:hypothetical protein
VADEGAVPILSLELEGEQVLSGDHLAMPITSVTWVIRLYQTMQYVIDVWSDLDE